MSTTVNSIPASDIVQIIPSVLPAGGNALDLSGVFLTTNSRVPIGTAMSFPDAASVGNFFGLTAAEYTDAAVPYFLGPDNSLAKPGALWFAQYPTEDVGAWLRGGSLATMTLAELQAITGVLTVTIDGTPHTSSSINLSSATSFTAAADLINNGLGLTGPTTASVTGSMGASFTGTGSGTNLTTSAVTGVIHTGDAITGTGVPANTTIVSQTSGTPGGAGVYVTNNSTTSSGASITATSTTLDVTAVSSGTVAVGNEITGSGIAAGSYITAILTGTGGVGTYTVSGSAQEFASTTITAQMPVVTYDTQASAFYVISSTGAASTISYGSGTIAAAINLTQATGAVISQGSAAATPADFMTALTGITQNWFAFSTMFDPDNGSGTTQKLLFSQWANGAGNRFAYVGWDTDTTPTSSASATSSFGYQASITLVYSGTIPIWAPSTTKGVNLAAFAMSWAASLNFTQTDGRTTLDHQHQSGLAADVTTLAAAQNLRANGYNFYGVWGSANQDFIGMADGTVTGPFEWADSFADQVWMSSSFQADLMTLLFTVRSIPYNAAGYSMIKSVCLDTINAALNFGSIRTGVPLSNAQIAEVNAAAGTRIDDVLSTQGWYLQVLPAAASVRQQRGSPPANFWWTDGESVQKITLNSILVQ